MQKRILLKGLLPLCLLISNGVLAQEKTSEKVTEKQQEKSEEQKLEVFKQALQDLNTGRYPDAEKKLQFLIEKNVLPEYAHYYYADLLKKTGQTQLAAERLRKVLTYATNQKLRTEAEYQLAEIRNDAGDFNAARNWLARMEKKQRRSELYPGIIYQLARSERGLGHVTASCKWLRKLYVSYPVYEKVLNWGPQLEKNQFEGRSTNCSASIDEKRKRIKNLQWAGYNDKAEKEVQLLRSVSGAEPGATFEGDRLEVAYLLHEGEVNKALDMLLSHYNERRGDFGYLVTLASAAARAGEGPAAVGAYYSAYKLAPRSKKGKEALYQSAFLSYQFQDYDGASRKFKEFIKIFPNSGLSSEAQWHLAWIKYLKQDFEGAYKSLTNLGQQVRGRRRARAFPVDRVNYWRAMSLFRLGDHQKAKGIFEGLAKDPLLGYYAITSQLRLKKLETLTPPRLAKPLRAEGRRAIARFGAEQVLEPIDMPYYTMPATTEENETEANVQLTPLNPIAEESISVAEEDEASEDSMNIGEQGLRVIEEEKVEQTSFANPILVKRFEQARDLMIVGLPRWAEWDLYDIERKTINKDYIKTLINEYQIVENYYRSAYLAHSYFTKLRAQHGLDGVHYLWEQTFPRAYAGFVEKYSKQFEVPTELIWGIMRAESQYRKEAISPVGALGLMQVMPNTAAKISQLMREPPFEAQKLLEPETAIKIGAKYLQRLMKKFDQNMALAAASYNAGPHRVKAWVHSFGNLDVDEFIDHIPFLETRNYVKRVLANIHIYSQVYPQKNSRDLLSYLSEPMKFKYNDPLPTKETWEDI